MKKLCVVLYENGEMATAEVDSNKEKGFSWLQKTIAGSTPAGYGLDSATIERVQLPGVTFWVDENGLGLQRKRNAQASALLTLLAAREVHQLVGTVVVEMTAKAQIKVLATLGLTHNVIVAKG